MPNTNIAIIFHRLPDLKLVVMASKDHERTFRFILYFVDFRDDLTVQMKKSIISILFLPVNLVIL